MVWARWRPCGAPFYAEEALEKYSDITWQAPYLVDFPTQLWALFISFDNMSKHVKTKLALSSYFLFWFQK